MFSESQEQLYVLTGVDHVPRQTCLGQERDFGGYETMWDAGVSRGAVTLLYG